MSWNQNTWWSNLNEAKICWSLFLLEFNGNSFNNYVECSVLALIIYSVEMMQWRNSSWPLVSVCMFLVPIL